MRKKTSNKLRSFKSNKSIAIAMLLLVLVVGGTLLSVKLINNNTKSNSTPPSQPGTSTPIKTTPSPAGESPNNPSNSSSSPSTASSTQTSQGNPATNLVTPFGTFVSNHHPNLSGSPSPNTEQSVCETTPGATCKITFANAGITKSLNAQPVDANGEALWNWAVQDLGLTQGSWQITATAMLNGQSKSTNDTLLLVVSP